jgi:subtilisin family serine protease
VRNVAFSSVLPLIAAGVLLGSGSIGSYGPAATEELQPWALSEAQAADVLAALAGAPDKTTPDFQKRLDFAAEGPLLRVMGLVQARDAETEAFLADNTHAVHWFEPLEGFLALVDAAQFVDLYTSPDVAFLEPDFRVVPLMATSTIAVNARSASGSGTGVWWYDSSVDQLKSDLGGTSPPLFSGAGVTVAVIDSGIDQTHRDFNGWDCVTPGPYQSCDSRIVAAVKVVDEIGPDSGLVPTSAMPTTDLASGHGTHVAGTVAANAYYRRNQGVNGGGGGDNRPFGVAPEANLVSVSNGDSQSAALGVQALAWTYRHVDDYNIKVATNSWGCLGGCSYSAGDTTNFYINKLYDEGVVVTFAAGNDGGSGSGAEFSGYSQNPRVISVAAYNDGNNRLADFSSRGNSATSNSLPTVSSWNPATETVSANRRPDLAAPGVSIVSTANLLGGTSSLTPRANTADVGVGFIGLSPYVTMSGTSMATPHVAGAAALLFDACPSATPLEVMRALYGTADSVLKTTGSSNAEAFEVGYGKLDARGALDDLRSTLSSC